MESESFRDGEDALNRIKQRWRETQQTYSLIFMDLCLPVMDGVQTNKAIRQFLSDKVDKDGQKLRPYVCLISSFDLSKI